MHIFYELHTTRRFAGFFLLILALLSGTFASAQIMDDRRHVDTLTTAERLSLRTNMVDWTLMIPNIGIEYDLGSTNYSRYAVGLNLRGRFNTSNTYDTPFTYAVKEVRLEGKQYWRERKAEPTGALRRHTNIFDKLMSCRRMNPHHPKTTYYRGLFLSYMNFDMRIPDVVSYGKRGSLAIAGLSWGFVRPLYGFSNGNSLDLELGASIGAAFGDWDVYMFNEEKSKNEYLWHSNWAFVHKPIVTDLRVGFIYRLGNYPIQKKYRWRYDVDMAYRALKDAQYSDADIVSWQKHQNDSLYKVANEEFRHLYDSITAVHAKEMQERIDVQADEFREVLKAEGGPVREKSRAQKKREKARRKTDDNARKEDDE